MHDLDLHVVGPDGVEVWAGHRQGGAGGGNATGGTRSIALRLGGRIAGKSYSMPLSLLAQNRTRLYWALAVGNDGDKDGVEDADDACPMEAGRWSPVAAERGCPDRDGDGIGDKVDACPTEPGIRTDDRKENGCPKRYGKAKLTAFGVEITEAILFATGSAVILPQSHALLRDVAAAMKNEPSRLRRVLLEGHTDNMGTAATNVKLSRDRVTAVQDWLTKTEGVDASRLELAWFGEDNPVASNTSDDGRARNRRVVFRVIEPVPTAPPSW